MVRTGTARENAAIASIERLIAQEPSPQELVEGAISRVMSVVDTEAFFLAGTDPNTRLCIGAGIVRGMKDQICQPFWDYELSVPDFNKFADLSVQDPVVDLHVATGGRPERSARWRAFNVISDLDAEMRALLTAGGRVWGVLQLNRCTDAEPFTEADLAFVRKAAPVIGRGLRETLLTTPAAPADSERGPGVMVLDETGALISATAEAESWLAGIPGNWLSPRNGIPIPLEVSALALTTAGADHPAARRRARLRTRDGVWLVAHASLLPGTGNVVVVIEPAKASEVAPLIIEAYDLTPREVEVTQCIARGLKTDEIGAQLFLSPHTVRDHVKAIFEKVGVKSRGELTSKIFAEHYHPTMEREIIGSHAREVVPTLE